MKPAHIPYGRHSISEEDIKSILDVLQSPNITQGPAVVKFEQALAEAVDSPYAVSTNSATSALHLACLSLGLGPGDHIWTSPITFVASANCARYCGAQVDFVDIDLNTGLISLEHLSDKLLVAARLNKLPKIIIPVHLAGTSAPMFELQQLVKPYGISIIEDASHAVGGVYRGQPVGNCSFSDITVFSFHPVKIITTAEGGAATTKDANLAARINTLRSHGIIKDQDKFEYDSNGPWSYEQQDLGFNYRLTDIQAALGMSQLRRLKRIVVERHQIWKRYQDLFNDHPVEMLYIPPDCLSAHHLAVIRLPGVDTISHRKIFEGMRNAGIGVQLHYSPVHLQPYYRRLGFVPGDFPQAEHYSQTSISLPLFPGLTIAEQNYVVESLFKLI